MGLPERFMKKLLHVFPSVVILGAVGNLGGGTSWMLRVEYLLDPRLATMTAGFGGRHWRELPPPSPQLSPACGRGGRTRKYGSGGKLLQQRLKQFPHLRRVARDVKTALFHDGELGVRGVCAA